MPVFGILFFSTPSSIWPDNYFFTSTYYINILNPKTHKIQKIWFWNGTVLYYKKHTHIQRIIKWQYRLQIWTYNGNIEIKSIYIQLFTTKHKCCHDNFYFLAVPLFKTAVGVLPSRLLWLLLLLVLLLVILFSNNSDYYYYDCYYDYYYYHCYCYYASLCLSWVREKDQPNQCSESINELSSASSSSKKINQ